MTLDITEKERQLLLEVIGREEKEIIQGLDHTESRDYKALLRKRLEIIEGLLRKVQSRTSETNWKP